MYRIRVHLKPLFKERELSLCAQQGNLGVQAHSRCSVSSVKRSARSATVSTAASECFMAVLV